MKGRNPVFESLTNPIQVNWKVGKSPHLLSLKTTKTQNKKRRKSQKARHIPKDYHVYIKSVWWSRRRMNYYKKHGRKCAVCGTSQSLNLHHLKYENFGSEADKHLLPLCRTHHKHLHEVCGVAHNMIDATHAFIEGARFEDEAATLLRSIA